MRTMVAITMLLAAGACSPEPTATGQGTGTFEPDDIRRVVQDLGTCGDTWEVLGGQRRLTKDGAMEAGVVTTGGELVGLEVAPGEAGGSVPLRDCGGGRLLLVWRRFPEHLRVVTPDGELWRELKMEPPNN